MYTYIHACICTYAVILSGPPRSSRAHTATARAMRCMPRADPAACMQRRAPRRRRRRSRRATAPPTAPPSSPLSCVRPPRSSRRSPRRAPPLTEDAHTRTSHTHRNAHLHAHANRIREPHQRVEASLVWGRRAPAATRRQKWESDVVAVCVPLGICGRPAVSGCTAARGQAAVAVVPCGDGPVWRPRYRPCGPPVPPRTPATSLCICIGHRPPPSRDATQTRAVLDSASPCPSALPPRLLTLRGLPASRAEPGMRRRSASCDRGVRRAAPGHLGVGQRHRGRAAAAPWRHPPLLLREGVHPSPTKGHADRARHRRTAPPLHLPVRSATRPGTHTCPATTAIGRRQ